MGRCPGDSSPRTANSLTARQALGRWSVSLAVPEHQASPAAQDFWSREQPSLGSRTA